MQIKPRAIIVQKLYANYDQLDKKCLTIQIKMGNIANWSIREKDVQLYKLIWLFKQNYKLDDYQIRMTISITKKNNN